MTNANPPRRFTNDILRDAVIRLGHDPRKVGLKHLRKHMGLPEMNGSAPDEAVAAALATLGSAMEFRDRGLRVIRNRHPHLQPTLRKGAGIRWQYLAPVAVGASSDGKDYTVRLETDIPPAVAGILEAMRLAGDPDHRADELAREQGAFEAALARDAHDAAAPWRRRLAAEAAAAGEDGPVLERRVHQRFNGRVVSCQPGDVAKQVRKVLNHVLKGSLEWLEEDRTMRRLRARCGYGDYVGKLAPQRGMRRIVFHAGPTNSGKTHAALEALKAARTGTYLAPLRLLALEGYERLKDAGLSAGMLTGEESIDRENATHLAQTIETLSLARRVEVAVIDEIQMLRDRDRGWAWTRALFGVPCDTLVLCGSEDVVPLVKRAAAITGEHLEIVRHARKTPLHVEEHSITIDHVQSGDAVIAFSRREVLTHREMLINAGWSVAAVYGALSPEVRRAEAERFASGEADILVATDAIGMGLNLGPLERVVFTDLEKFDGTMRRELTPAEIRQIAGRAGRFGHHSAGYVTSLVRGGNRRIRAALAGARDDADDGLTFLARPDPEMVQMAAEELGTASLATVLEWFGKRTVYDGSPFKPAALEEMHEAASRIDHLPLPIQEKFAFATCPIDRRDESAVWRLVGFASARSQGKQAPVPAVYARTSLEQHEGVVKMMSAYLWLAMRFPETFTDVQEAIERRTQSNDAIERHLSETATRRATKAAARR